MENAFEVLLKIAQDMQTGCELGFILKFLISVLNSRIISCMKQ